MVMSKYIYMVQVDRHVHVRLVIINWPSRQLLLHLPLSSCWEQRIHITLQRFHERKSIGYPSKLSPREHLSSAHSLTQTYKQRSRLTIPYRIRVHTHLSIALVSFGRVCVASAIGSLPRLWNPFATRSATVFQGKISPEPM